MPSTETVVRKHSRMRATAVHALRIAVFAGIVTLLRVHHVRISEEENGAPLEVDPALLAVLFDVGGPLEIAPARGAYDVFDSMGESVGGLIQTAPESNRVAGFSGSTNLILGLDQKHRVCGMAIASSGDTRDHVQDIKNDPAFLKSLNGLTLEQAQQRAPEVDSVSGATLTSLAILEGLMRRLARENKVSQEPVAMQSLRFPDAIGLNEAQAQFPQAMSIEPRARWPKLIDVLDGAGQRVGALLRTSPSGDQTIGYQGPTDTLLVFDAEDKLLRMLVRRSYDNEPYVGYIRDDDYFAESLAGRALVGLAKLDLVEAQVEGVSGATMTSMAMAESMPLAVRDALREVAAQPKPPAPRGVVFAIRDLGTMLVLLLACLLAFTRLRGLRWFRLAFQFVLVGYLGFLNGDLISQAQLIGWSRSGVPWRFAPGLAALTAASFLIPLFTKRQIYCQQICPFGAAQQLVRPKSGWKLPRMLQRLKVFPFLLLAFCVVVGFWRRPIDLASLEPFDAFLFGGAASLAIAAVGMLAALRIPLAYCRYGCPTGAVLGFIRWRARADRLDWRDAIAGALLLFGLLNLFWIS